ncbi:polysaccharide biosynthesis protein [Ruminococcaceae bacterium OttesenSCG-928-A16]|nr:polysaccharide biosynthesis protein [Ruminococcaceae bacterium OttesenSCG-928-A16]
MSRTIAKFLSKNRKLILITFDILVEIIVYVVPWILIQGYADLHLYYPLLISSCFFFICCFEIAYGLMGMYDSLWRYAEVVEFFRLVVASAIAVAIFIVGSLFIFEERRISLSMYLLSAMFATSVTLYSRLTYRMYRNTKFKKRGRPARRVMVIGAGEAAATLLHEQNKNPDADMNIICVVDDAPEKVGRYIMGVQILGTTTQIPELVEQCEIETIVMAIPTVDEKNRKRILQLCAKTKCNLRILPNLRQMMSDGGELTSRIRDVRVEDLLGRETVELSGLSHSMVSGKVVLVTGGGGSIGSELCRQIAAFHPRRLIIVDIYENNAYSIQQELFRAYNHNLDLEVLIASVRDSKKMDKLFDRIRPDIVFHAAAHKHVPLMEYSPEEAVKNNIFGTLNVAAAASKYGAARFVLISSDKAVNPTNVMGATKRVCEMVVQAMAQQSKTAFVAVRFGNVLGSNGSVLPLFKQQIEAGGPLTVTHPEIVRYFMTIPEAVSLVLEAAAMGDGGDVFVLDMGEPVKIVELAENLIKLAGFIPYDDIKIEFTGLRPGEKLYEELLMDEEGLRQTDNQKIFIGSPLLLNQDEFSKQLVALKETAYANDSNKLMQQLQELVPTFHHEPNKVED